MAADHTKAVFASPFQAYRNVGVYNTTIEVGTAAITPGNSATYSTTITVDDPGHFATTLVQTNDYSGSGPFTPTALRWSTYPPSYIVWIALTTDPYSAGSVGGRISLAINGNQVTFSIIIPNPYDLNIATAATTVGIQYSIHSVRDG